MNKPTGELEAELTDAADVCLQVGQTADQPRVVRRSVAHGRALMAALQKRGQAQDEADDPEGEQWPPEPCSSHCDEGPPEKSPNAPDDTRTLSAQLIDNRPPAACGDVFSFQ